MLLPLLFLNIFIENLKKKGKKKIASDTRFYIQKLLAEYLLAINVKVNKNREEQEKRNCMKESGKIINFGILFSKVSH